MSLVQKAVKRYNSDGIVYLINEIWRFIFDTLEPESPEWIQKIVVQLYWFPYLMILTSEGNKYRLKHLLSGESFYFPQLQHHRRYRRRGLERKKELYYGFEHTHVDPGDTVVDIGAFIGEPSIPLSDTVSEIYAIEPSPRSFACLKKNVEDINNITALNYAVWNQPGEKEFQQGVDATDDSILHPDHGGDGVSVIVQAETLENICTDRGISEIDFLKVEAEGVEPEVLDGMEDIHVKKMAVNCDPERNGESTKKEVQEMLTNSGYRVIEGNDPYYTILYAELSESAS